MIGDLPPEGYRTSFGHSARRVAKLAGLVRPYKGRTVLALLALLGTTAAALAGPYVAKLAIDDGITPHDRRALVGYVVLYLVLAVIGLALESAQTYLTTWVGQRVLTDLRVKLFAHLQSLELGYFEEQRTGRLISRLTNDVDALEQLVTDGVTSTVQNTLTLAGTAALMLLLDWRLALVTLVVFPLMAISTGLFRLYSSRAYRRMRERLAEGTAALQEDISGARVVQAFRREERNLEAFADTNEVYRDANRQTVLLNGLYFPFVELLSSVATAIVLAYGGYRFFEGDMELGTLFAFIAYLSNFFDPVQALSQLYNTFLAANAALDKIFDVMDTEPRLRERPGAVTLGPLQGQVDLDDVRFGYGDGPDGLHGVDLHVGAGHTVALVGH